jgi:hypothetical protein
VCEEGGVIEKGGKRGKRGERRRERRGSGRCYL